MAKQLAGTVQGKISVAEQYTAGEIAFLMRIAHRTACKILDEGTIPSFRLPGTSGRGHMRERRVHHKALMKFIDLNPDYAYMLERLDGDVTQFDAPETSGRPNGKQRATRGRGPVRSQDRNPAPSISRRPKPEPTWDDLFE